jgi:hypothetical protein
VRCCAASRGLRLLVLDGQADLARTPSPGWAPMRTPSPLSAWARMSLDFCRWHGLRHVTEPVQAGAGHKRNDHSAADRQGDWLLPLLTARVMERTIRGSRAKHLACARQMNTQASCTTCETA